MKRLYSTAALLIFGLATPVLVQAISPTIAVAKVVSPDGSFGDQEWNISVFQENNTYKYSGYNNRTKKSIQLSGATVLRDGQRKIYTWNNGGTRYQVIWQSKDPDYVRVRVTTPNGTEVLNRLLSRSEEGC
jgi:hypothetical protein